MNKHFIGQISSFKGTLLLCTVLVTGLAGCSSEDSAPRYQEMNRGTTLESELQQSPEPSPIMLDVYNRSIPEEVYSGE